MSSKAIDANSACLNDIISTPGEILQEEFLEPLGISRSRLAAAIDRPEAVIDEIVNGVRPIDGEYAVLLGKALGATPQFWLNLETAYQMDMVDLSIQNNATKLV